MSSTGGGGAAAGSWDEAVPHGQPQAEAAGAAAADAIPRAGGWSSGGGAAARPPAARWIDPDLLEVKFLDCVCALCFGVMVVPSSGCPQGHAFCGACLDKALRERPLCPTCRHPVDTQRLVRSRPLEGVISQLFVRCEHAAVGEGSVATGAPAVNPTTSAPAASTTYKVRMTALLQRGLDSVGWGGERVARLEEDRTKDGGCMWRGTVGELAAHLGECEWAPVRCPHKDCTESPLRKDLMEHQATCDLAPTSWLFDWRADGWGADTFRSEVHDFGAGVQVQCFLTASSNPQHSHFIGFTIQGRVKFKPQAMFSVVDKNGLEKSILIDRLAPHDYMTPRVGLSMASTSHRRWG